MLDAISEPFVLILDDYHLIDDSLEINALLKRLLEHRPDHLHMILSSRTSPAGLPVIQLVARSQIAGIGLEHLAFTAGEIQEYLRHAHNIDLNPAQAQELARESEGWITGILLSREAMWHGIRDNLIRARAQEGPVYSYLAEQVFALRATTRRAPGDDHGTAPDSWATVLGLVEHALEAERSASMAEHAACPTQQGRIWNNVKRWIGKLV